MVVRGYHIPLVAAPSSQNSHYCFFANITICLENILFISCSGCICARNDSPANSSEIVHVGRRANIVVRGTAYKQQRLQRGRRKVDHASLLYMDGAGLGGICATLTLETFQWAAHTAGDPVAKSHSLINRNNSCLQLLQLCVEDPGLHHLAPTLKYLLEGSGSRGRNGFAPLSGLPNLWCVFQPFPGERDGEEKSDGWCVVPFIQVQVEGNNT